MKRILPLFLILVLLFGCSAESIGTIRGAELETIVIDGAVYELDAADEFQSFSAANRGDFLGTVTNGKETFRVYTLKGDEARQYLYVLWGYEGNIYVRTE